MDVDQISTLCLESVADIENWGRRYDWQTAVWAVLYIVHASRHHARVELYRAFQFLGKLYIAEGDELTAKSLLTVALTGFTYMEIHRGKAECMLSLGDIAKKNAVNLPINSGLVPGRFLSDHCRQKIYLESTTGWLN